MGQREKGPSCKQLALEHVLDIRKSSQKILRRYCVFSHGRFLYSFFGSNQNSEQSTLPIVNVKLIDVCPCSPFLRF